jgi:hypothetical protein
MGWGDTTSDDQTQDLADVLMSVNVNVISNSDCDASSGSINGWTDSYNGQITSNMLCAADKGQDSVCYTSCSRNDQAFHFALTNSTNNSDLLSSVKVILVAL